MTFLNRLLWPIRRLNTLTDGFLQAPVSNASSRLGLARIIFGFYALWFFSALRLDELALMSELSWRYTDFTFGLRPAPEFILLVEYLIPFSLVLLILGWKTRWVSWIVFALLYTYGISRANALGAERSLMMLTFYVPLLMSFSNWGDRYSLDALLRQRRDPDAAPPSETDWSGFWPVRVILVIFCFLFFTSGYIKLIENNWLSNPTHMTEFIGFKSVGSFLNNGMLLNPIAPWLVNQPLVNVGTYLVIAFELSFPLLLISRPMRWLLMRAIPAFHLFNMFILGIPFTPVAAIYTVFPDWQGILDRMGLRLPQISLSDVPTWGLHAAPLLLALATALTWNMQPGSRDLIQLGGLFRTPPALWAVVGVASLIWYADSAYDLWRWWRERRGQPAEALSSDAT